MGILVSDLLAGLAEIDDLSAEKDRNFEVITIVSPDHKGEKDTADFIEWYKGLEYKNITVLLDEKAKSLTKQECVAIRSISF